MPLREDAEAIWLAGVTAVDSSAAVSRQIHSDGKMLRIAEVELQLEQIERVEIVGAGKAGAGMALGLELALLKWIDVSMLSGWINVPADCIRPLKCIHLHAARPAGRNEPTAEGTEGTEEILRRIRSLTPRDVCIVLLSGGASALLCSPVPEITLADKLAVTRILSAAGAPIHELNLVRTQLSRVKGGRLAAACNAGLLVGLIISDVIGDPLDIIGSGPTVAAPLRAGQAIDILSKYQVIDKMPVRVVQFLKSHLHETVSAETLCHIPIRNVIVASNSIAMEAATTKARQLGYQVQSLGSENAGDAATRGRELIKRMRTARSELQRSDGQPVCVLSGGEPTVDLSRPMSGTDNEAGLSPQELPAAKGGRNQELVLAAIVDHSDPADWAGLTLLSGGTDGEDGPTDAAGAFADQSLVSRISETGINPRTFLARHDSYHFFEAVAGLFKTGPTHTNVMDLRVGLVNSDRATRITKSA